jgi:hypothetical protein
MDASFREAYAACLLSGRPLRRRRTTQHNHMARMAQPLNAPLVETCNSRSHPPVGLGLPGWHALAGVLAVVPLFATSAVPDAAIGLALVSIWVLGGVVSAPVALGGFATATWALVVSVSAIGSAIASTGLLYRAALWLAAHSRGGFAGQVLALGLSGLGLEQAIPDATARVTLLAPAALEMAETGSLGSLASAPTALVLALAVVSRSVRASARRIRA